MDMLNTVRFIILFWLCGILVSSCAKIDNIALGITSETLGVNTIDTFTVEASTLQLDPLPTGGRGRLLLGSLTDEGTGKVSSSTYFRILNPSFSVESFPTDVSYDSLSMRLFYDGYSYGDTTAQMSLAVYRVLEDITPREIPISLEDDETPLFVSGATLYSDQGFAYDTQSLGSITFRPKPKSTTDTVNLRLNDELGRTFLSMMLNNDSRMSSQDEFISFFKGLAIVPGSGAKSIVGFRDSVVMDLYYSYERQSDGKKVSASIQFSIASATYQHNNIHTDRSATALEGLDYVNPELSSIQSGNRVFLQGGTGLVTKLTFPTVRTELNSASRAISRAELIIETDQSEIGYFLPPASLILMKANKYGTPTSLVSSLNGTGVQASYQTPNDSGGPGRGKYVFNITDYISNLKSSSSYREDESILVSLPTTDLLSTFNLLRVAQDGEKPRIKLNIVYINF